MINFNDQLWKVKRSIFMNKENIVSQSPAVFGVKLMTDSAVALMSSCKWVRPWCRKLSSWKSENMICQLPMVPCIFLCVYYIHSNKKSLSLLHNCDNEANWLAVRMTLLPGLVWPSRQSKYHITSNKIL